MDLYILNYRPEINIKPWVPLMEDLKQGNKRTKWSNREAYAYWKGNIKVSMVRYKLLECNLSREHDWKARVFMQVSTFQYQRFHYYTLILMNNNGFVGLG